MSIFSASAMSKPKKPPRLEYANDQVFIVDSKANENGVEDVYVWIYEAPPGLKTWLMGFALILGVLLLCAHQLWPPSLRLVLYYVLMILAFFAGFIVLLGMVRFFTFALIFILSLSRLRLWIFPNLFADCGFFESFRPLYSFERVETTTATTSSSTKSSTSESPPSVDAKSVDGKTD